MPHEMINVSMCRSATVPMCHSPNDSRQLTKLRVCTELWGWLEEAVADAVVVVGIILLDGLVGPTDG